MQLKRNPILFIVSVIVVVSMACNQFVGSQPAQPSSVTPVPQVPPTTSGPIPTPPANVYIVWVRPGGGDATRQGAIGLDNDLNGELKVVTTLKDFDLFVTAEQSETVTVPSNLEILRTHVSLS